MTQEKKKRGFAAMSPERQREIARMGGKAVPASKRGFSLDRELASHAGRKGGKAVPAGKRSYSIDSTLASESGRKGGLARKGVKTVGNDKFVETGDAIPGEKPILVEDEPDTNKNKDSPK